MDALIREKHTGRRKLGPAEVRKIKELLSAGESNRSIAKKFRVSPPTIANIRNGKRQEEPQKTGPKPLPAIKRFWKHVDKRGKDECWPWLGANRNHQAGATFSVDGKQTMAYRFAFKLHYNQELTRDDWVMHTCNDNNCMNPYHMYVGDRYDWARKWHSLEATEEHREVLRERAQKRSRARYQAKRDEIRSYVAAYQLEKKLQAMEVLGGCCQKCSMDHPAALQFHHRDPDTKAFSISSKTLSSPQKFPWDLILVEIAKCDLLCANCHAIHHSTWTEERILEKRQYLATLDR